MSTRFSRLLSGAADWIRTIAWACFWVAIVGVGCRLIWWIARGGDIGLLLFIWVSFGFIAWMLRGIARMGARS